jgi:hypothetical protein
MNKLILATVLCFTTLFFSNCDKNDDPPAPPPPTKTELITKSSWKFSSAKAGGFDVTAQIPACFKDNTITFVATGTGTISEGAVACSPAAPATFTWSFQSSETQINLNTPLITGGSGLFTIVKLDAVNLVVSQNMTIPPAPGPVNVELTFIH